MALALIAAVARNGTIGKGNDLVFRERADQAHFRATTLGCPVLMGRRTWDSLPERFRPLPGRRNLVMTRRSDWQAPGAEVVHTLDEALHAVDGVPWTFVMGGAELYALALPLAQRLELTEVDADLDGDVVFPPWDRGAFVEVRREPQVGGDGTRFAFVTYHRR